MSWSTADNGQGISYMRENAEEIISYIVHNDEETIGKEVVYVNIEGQHGKRGALC